MTAFQVNKYEHLVERIVAGDVVFFVGAGFSLDSEGNSAQRLIARLVVRLLALTEKMPKIDPPLEDLRESLCLTFGLKEKDKIASEETVEKLAANYYLINDWTTNAYETLMTAALKLPDRAGFFNALNTAENELLGKVSLKNKTDAVPLDAINPDLFAVLPAGERGKALFLDTLGFCQPAIMAGRFDNVTLEDVMGDFRGLLRDRHRVLARLAREGLCPLLITTNYDLLLEGACRLAGFKVPGFGVNDAKPAEDRMPPTTYSRLMRVCAPRDFFERGSAYRSALLVKIHGCAERYRVEKPDRDRWSAYLPSVVFTYREIQSWRQDSWSRDLVSTLLRTKTMVLCGYSGADPVLHHTIRTVYEEIRAQNRGRPGEHREENVRAWFTGSAGSREFYGIEILRAASRAAGIDNPRLGDHDNYLPFYFLSEGKFPNLDQTMVWIGHRTMRRLQESAMKTDLRRVVSHLLRSPVREADLEVIREHFRKLIAAEVEMATAWQDEGACQWEFRRVTGWTDRFHASLLREFAHAEAVQSNQGPGIEMEYLRAARTYFPISDQPGWAAWGVVIEIALRRMLAAVRGQSEDWRKDHRWVEPAECEFPAVLFANERHPAPVCLLLRFAAFERADYRPDIRGVYRRLVIWDLVAGLERKKGDSLERRTPAASRLWRWAIAPEGKVWETEEVDRVRKWLGEA